MTHLTRAVCVAVTLGVLSPSVATAGPAADELGKCLVRSTTDQEKAALVKWIFVGAALHPDVRDTIAVTPAQREQASRTTAKLVERLLADDCKGAAREAVRREGFDVLRTSFTTLIQGSSASLFTNPAVTAFFAEFGQYMDMQNLLATLAPR